MGRSRGGTGGLDPTPEKSQNIGFLINTAPDPLKSQSSMLGHHQHASELPMAFRWRANEHSVTLAGRSCPLIVALDPPSPHQLKKKYFVKVGTPLTKLSGSLHVCKYFGTESKLFDTLIVFLEEYFFKNHIFGKNQQMTAKA